MCASCALMGSAWVETSAMVVTFSVLTLTLAKAYGLYILVTGLSGLAAPLRWKAVIDDYQRSPALTYLTAVIVLGVGLTLVSIHSLWTDPVAIIVSLVGWMALVEGVALAAFPDGLMKFGAATVATPGRTRAWAIFAVILGAALLVAGLIGRADVSA
jgi:uncharacterized membrane protein YidH (DUF202 family)